MASRFQNMKDAYFMKPEDAYKKDGKRYSFRNAWIVQSVQPILSLGSMLKDRNPG